MNFLTSTLGRYLLQRSLIGIGIVLACVAATVLLVDAVEQLRTLSGRTEGALLNALKITAMRAPNLLEQTLPFVVLAGVMLALFDLNRRSELVAIRAAGVSAWRFLAPVMSLAALIGLISALALNPLGLALYQAASQERLSLLDPSGVASDGPEGIWLWQGDDDTQTVIRAESIDLQRLTLKNALFITQDVETMKFSRRISAAEAQLGDGFWQLRDAVDAAPGQAAVREAEMAIPTPLSRATLLDRFAEAQTLSFWGLPPLIADARRAGLTPTRYELRFQSLLALPALLAALAALGAAFSMRLQRLGGLAQWSLTGLAAGFLLFFAQQFAGAFATAEALPTWLAAWAPPIAGFSTAMAVIGYLEDG